MVSFYQRKLWKRSFTLAAVTRIFKMKVFTFRPAWKLEHVALGSHINKVNNLESVDVFSRPELKYC
jgi:hypothetical protein